MPRRDGKPTVSRTDSQGEGPLNGRTRDQLYNVAKSRGIIGRGHMSRAELLKAIDRAPIAGMGTD